MAGFTPGYTWDYSTKKSVTAANLASLITSMTITRTSAGDTDNSTVEVSSNKYQLKDGGTTNAKMADMAQNTMKGRVSSGSGAPEDLTTTQVKALLGIDTLETNTAGNVRQVVVATTTTGGSTTTAMPVDTSIPQNTEGAEILTCAITPKSATNKLLIFFGCPMRNNTAPTQITPVVLALFQDSTANALAAAQYGESTDSICLYGVLMHTMTAGTTSETTFKIRGGPDATTGRLRWLQGGDGSDLFSTTAVATLIIIEYAEAA